MPPRCCEDHARLVADKLANGKEPKEARRPAPHNRYRDGAPQKIGLCAIFCVGYTSILGSARSAEKNIVGSARKKFIESDARGARARARKNTAVGALVRRKKIVDGALARR